MAAGLKYQDYSIRVLSDGGAGLTVRVERSPYGGLREAKLNLPFGPDEVDALLHSIEFEVRKLSSASAAALLPARDFSRPAKASCGSDLEHLGDLLFGALFPPPLRESFLQCLGWAEGDPERALRLRVSLAPSSELLSVAHSLPWELLYRAETRDFLSRSVRTPIVRRLESPRLLVHEIPAPPLRVLVAVSSPHGAVPLDLERERRRIGEAWGKRSEVEVEYLPNATIEKVHRAMREQAFHVLHFMGHGSFDPVSNDSVLLFETAEGDPEAISAQVFAETLKSSRCLRLVFLNACETALLPRRSGKDPYTGVASALVMAGVPMVLAMQFSISDRAAIDFSNAFYTSLADGDLAETALSEGRLAIHRAAPDSWEWITPVLFMGMDEGRILSPSAPLPKEEIVNKYNPVVTGSKGVVFGETVSIDGGLHIQETFSPAEEAKHYRELGAESLQLCNYQAAAQSFRTAADRNGGGDREYYALALATLGRRRPFKLTRPEIREIEDHIQRALRLNCQPHYLLFWAFLKYDYFVLNGMPAGEPTCQALVSQALAGRPDRAELEKLLLHLPAVSNNPVLPLIAEVCR